MMLVSVIAVFFFFFFKQKTAYEMRISDWSSDVCSSDLGHIIERRVKRQSVGGIGCYFARELAPVQIGLDAVDGQLALGRTQGRGKFGRLQIFDIEVADGNRSGQVDGIKKRQARRRRCALSRRWRIGRWRRRFGGSRSEEHTTDIESIMRIR